MITQANQLLRLNVRYFGALHAAVAAHSTEGAAQKAKELGGQAFKLGLGTPELTRIHQRALRELTAASGDPEDIQRLIARAVVFFNATQASLMRQGHLVTSRPWNHHAGAHAEAIRTKAD